jgi:L-alanine-DL-glutamate epimerase-like enolase superfamily enzyme
VEDGINILVEINDSITGSFNPKSAVEIAIYDILSQNKNKPLYQYLGGKISELKTGTTISLNPVVQMVSDAKEAVDLGFESLKIKFGSSPKEDIERINAIRQAIDTSISIKLDANQGWSPDETVRFLDQITSLDIDIELLEQPVPKNDLTGLKYIKDRTPIPILADESVFSPEDAREILEMDAVDMINIKLDKCGGITKALEVAEISAEYDTKCMIGCMLEGAISVGAAAHVASARSDTIIMYDLDAPILCASSPVKGGVKFVASDVLLSDALGLGITSIPDIEWLN